MIVLENGDKLRGDATSAAEVDFTIHGLDNNALKQLADGQLANAIGDLYTADSTDVVSSVILVNAGAAHNHVNLYLTPSGGTARRLIPKDLQLEPGYSLHFDGAKILVMNANGGITNSYFAHKTSHQDGGDDEISVTGLSGLLADDQHVLDTEVLAVAVGPATTNTLTNKRITSRITTIVSNANPTVNTDDCDAVTITAQAADIASMTTNLSGTPTDFQKLIVRIKDNATARAITWGASFESKGLDLPTTTVLSKVLTVGFIYDTVTAKWGCVALAQEA